MQFLNLKKRDSKLKIKVNEKDKLIKKISNFTNKFTNETEYYIKNNLIIFMLILLTIYNYDKTIKISYLPFLLGKKFLNNIGLINNFIDNL